MYKLISNNKYDILKKPLLQIAKWIFLGTVLVWAVMPVVWLIIASFKTNQEIFTSSLSLPAKMQFHNYLNVFKIDGIIRAFTNSMLVSGLSMFLCLLFSAMTGYSLMHKFKIKNKLFSFLIIGMYMPVNAFILPYFVISITTKTYDTIWGLIITYTAIGLPMSILILKGYMDSIPEEISESAVIDGCNFYKRFTSIILPLSIPGMATIGIFQFVSAWNEFLFSMMLTQSATSRTLQLSMRYFLNTYVSDYASMFAVLVVCLLPTIIVYTLMQEQIISGLTSGALKG